MAPWRLAVAACFAWLCAEKDDGLALTPPRGWRSWNTLLLDISQDVIAAQLAALDDSGLIAAGYTRLGIDDGWQACGAGVNGSFHVFFMISCQSCTNSS